MRTPILKSPLGLAAPLGAALVLAACTQESESVNAGEDDLPDTEFIDDPDAISDPTIADTVPGVESVDTEGDAASTAGVRDEGDADYTDPGYDPELPSGVERDPDGQ
jgi:hypothetical protein